MAKYSNTVEYNIRTTLDNSGISKLQSELTQLQNKINVMGAKKLIPQESVNKTLADITKVKNALTQAFNPKLGMLNTSAFLKNIDKAGLSMSGLYQSFSKAGASGVAAFNSMYGQIAKIDTGMRSVSSTTDKIMNTLGNTVRWGLIASGFAAVMKSVHSAAEYVKDLDKSLTNIQMVTASARDTMNDFAVEANKVAQRLGGTTVQMTNATEVFIRQGYDLATSTQLGEYAVHLANVSGQDSAMASDEITAYMNAFKIPLEDLGNAVSKWAAVANNAAVSVEELSVASQKAAAVATTVGVDMDQFAAHIAAIEATTREAPENIGNGLKTIYSRIADIKLGETLEDGVDLGSFAKAIEKVGVQVLDTTGNLRNAGDILQDLMVVWQDLDQTQRAAVAKTVAGRFQLARFEALMNSADIYQTALTTSRAETGTVTYDRMQETYRNSLEGRSKALQASVEEIFLNLFSTDTFYPAIDALQGLVDTINDLIKATGGGETALIGLVSVMTTLASNTMSRGISNFIVNRQADAAARQNVATAQDFARAQLAGQGLSTTNSRFNAMAQDVAGINQHGSIMNEAQIRQSNELLQQRIQIENDLAIVTEKHNQLEEGLSAAFNILGESANSSSGELIKLWEAYKSSDGDIQILDKDFKKLQSSMQIVGEKIIQLTDLFEADSVAFKNNLSIAKEASVILDQVTKSGAYEGEQLRKLISVKEILVKISKGEIQTHEELAQALKRAAVAQEDFTAALQTTAQYGEKAGAEIKKTKTQMADLSAAADHAAGKMQQMSYGLQLQKATNQIIGLTSAAMSFVFVLQSMENLSSIWENEDLDFGGKIKASLLDFTMIAAMAIPMIGQLKEGFAGIAQAIKLTTAAHIAGSKEAVSSVGLQIIANEELTRTEKSQQIQKITGLSVIKNEAVVEALELQSKGQLNKATLEEIALRRGVSVETLKEALAKTAGTAANYGFAASLKAVWLATGPMLGIAVAIGAAVAGVKMLINWYNKDAKAAEDAAKSSQKLAEQLQATKQRSEELDKSISSYREAMSALSDLTKGTEEWNTQLEKTNDTVIDLLTKYPELAKYITKLSSGELRISNQGLVELEERQKNELDQARAAASMAQVHANEAQTRADSTYLRRSIDWSEQQPGSEYPTVSFLNESQWEKIVKKVQDEGPGVLGNDEALADLLGVNVSHPMIQAIKEAADLIAKHVDRREETELQNKLLSESALETYLRAQGVYSDANGLGSQTVHALSLEQQRIYDEKFAEYQNQSIEDLTQQYLASDEGKRYRLKSTDSHWAPWDNGQAEAVLIDPDTKEEFTLTKEMMAESLASADSMVEAAKLWDEVANKLLGINNTNIGKDYHGADTGVLSGERDTEGNTNFDFNSMTSHGMKRFLKDNADTSDEDLMNTLGIDDKFAQQRGFESGRAYISAFRMGMTAELNERTKLDKKLDEGSSWTGEGTAFQDWGSGLTEIGDIAGRSYTNGSESYRQQAEEILNTAESVYELDEAFDRSYLTIKDYEEGLLTLGQNYSDLKPQTDKLKQAQEKYDKVLAKTDHTEEELLESQQELIDAQEKLTDSIKTKEWAKARDMLQDYADDLENAEENEVAYSRAAQQVADVLSDLTGLDVSADWIKENNEAVQDWLNRMEGAGAKLDALLSFDSLPDNSGIIQKFEEIGWAYDDVRNLIASNKITFDAEGRADFSQLIAEMEASGLSADEITEKLMYLSAYMAAVGNGSIEITKDGTSLLKSPPAITSDMTPEQVTAAINDWQQSITKELGTGWTVSGIDLPDSPMSIPTRNTGGGGGSSGGSGGGGGGGGSKGKSIKAIEPKDAKIDPYQKVNAELEKLADEYTEVDKAKDRMYGDRYRRAQEQEIKNLQQQNEKLEERVKISEKLIEAYRTGQDNPEYGIYLNGESFAKYGFTDEDLDGIIDNPWDRIEELRKDYYAKVEAANAYAGEDRSEEDQAEFERLSAIADEAHELWSGAQNFADEYQEAWDKVRDDTQQIRENMYEIEDKIIDVWNYAKDAAKELGEFREDQIDLAETLATLWGDDAVKSLGFAFDRFTNMFEANEKSLADAIIDYQNRLNKATDENMKQWYQDQINLAQKAMANGTSVLDLNMQRMNEIYKAIDEWKDSGRSELFGSNEKAMWEAFDEAWEDAVDYAKKLKGYIEDIHDNIGQVMDDMYDAMDRRNDLFDQVDNQYEYLKNMTELVHGEKAYDMLEKVTRKQAQAGEERLKTLEEERKVNHDMLEKLEKGSEEYLQALEKEQELDKDILDVRENIAETYKEAKELANELAVQNWLDNFTADINGVEVPLEYAADQWERIKENADNYLDDLNRAWELEKLENEYLKLIDDAVDPNIQKQITKQMQEQLGYLREKDKLSEYDVKYANAQLEILQKTIALEDARANKNQMKLRRDSQGNYSYVYAANRNDVRDKENDLLDARMNGYNMSVEASRNATDDYFNQIQNMADKLRSVANDASLSAEQVDAITQDIIDKGYEYLNAKGEQLTTAQRNGIESYIQAAKELSELNAGNVLDMSRRLEEGLVDDLGMVTDTFHTAVKDWVDGETGLAYFREAADQTGRDLVRNVEDFVIAVGEANTNIEEPLSGIETKFVDTNTALTNLMASAQDFYGFLEEKSGIVGQAAEDLANYQTALTEMNSKMNDYYNAWEQRGKELESEKAINSQLRIDMNNLQEEYETKLAEAQRRAGGGSGGSGSSGSTDTSNGSVVGYSGRYYSDSWGNGPSGNWFADQPGAVRISSFSRRSGYGDYNVHLETLNGGHLGWVKESQLFDTGGYTGAWGPGGKAAILHEKELVLNAQDTQNMLAAVSVVRGLVEMLKGSTFNLNNMSQRGFASNGIGNNVEQRVEITAEFPNVRSAADIETALLNLSNNAYQYAYNKNEKFM